MASNSLATKEQISDLYSCDPYRKCDILRKANTLMQIAGIYLKLDQATISCAMVLLTRYLMVDSTIDIINTAPASLFVAAKVSNKWLSPSELLRVICFVKQRFDALVRITKISSKDLGGPGVIPDGHGPHCEYPPQLDNPYQETLELYSNEMELLAGLGFDTRVALPHSLALTYLNVLDLRLLAESTWALVSDALRLAPLICVIHQPAIIACACIWIQATRAQICIADADWWVIFEVDQEDIAHCILLVLEGLDLAV